MRYMFTSNLRTLMLLVFSGAIIGLALGYGPLLRYKSSSILTMDMKTSDFRKFQEVVMDPSAFNRYESHLANDESKVMLIPDLKKIVLRQSKWIEPVQRLTKQDVKDFTETARNTEDNFIFGLRFSAQKSSPEQAQELTRMQADYCLDVALRSSVLELLRGLFTNKVTQLDRAKVERIRTEYEIINALNRLKEFRRIAQAYPDSARVDARQLISVDKGGERFMPIPSQMAAIETQIVDMREQITRSDRDLKKLPLEIALLKQQIEGADKSNAGSDAINIVINLAHLSYSNATEEWAQQSYLENLNSFVDLRVKYVDRPVYLASPNLPESPEQPRPLVMTFLGILFAIFGFAIWQYRVQIAKLIYGGEIKSDANDRKVLNV
jgi:hypothetical protein